MNILKNYKRENKFVNGLNDAFDEFIEISKIDIENILNTTDIIVVSDNELNDRVWSKILKDGDDDEKLKLNNKFIRTLQIRHNNYKLILRRFTEEHLKFPNAITFTLKNQISYIKDVIRRLEIDYFKVSESKYDDFIFSFRDICITSLNDLIREITIEYKNYLKNQIEVSPIYIPSKKVKAKSKKNDIDEDDDYNSLQLNTVSSRIVLMNKLGIIDFLKEEYPNLKKNNTHLAKVLGKFVRTSSYDSIRKCVSDINTGRKNDPYNNTDNIINTENVFQKYIDK